MVKNSLDLRSFFKKKPRFNYSTEHIHLIGLFHCLQVLIFVSLTSPLYACMFQAALLILVLTSTVPMAVLYRRKAVHLTNQLIGTIESEYEYEFSNESYVLYIITRENYSVLISSRTSFNVSVRNWWHNLKLALNFKILRTVIYQTQNKAFHLKCNQ